MSALVKFQIDGKMVEAAPGTLVINAAKGVGIEIPAFCYYDGLTLQAACRMCLVEVEKSPKLVTACTLPVAEGMVVRTDTPQVIQARKSMLEFLLSNHPLDCPVCDKGGECELQDLTFRYGADVGRFSEMKVHVPEKKLSPIVYPLPLPELQLRLYHVRAGGFTGLFLFIRNIQKPLRLTKAGLRVAEFALRRNDCEVVLHHRGVQTARRHLHLRAGSRLRGERAVRFPLAEERENFFVNLRLFVINLHAVIRHKNAGRSAIALRIDVLVEGAHGGQTVGANLRTVLPGLQHGEVGALNLAGVLFGPRDGVGERHRGGRGRLSARKTGDGENGEKERSELGSAHNDQLRQCTSETVEAEDWLKGLTPRAGTGSAGRAPQPAGTPRMSLQTRRPPDKPAHPVSR